MVMTPHFHYRGPGFNPWSGNKDPANHVVQPAKKQNMIEMNLLTKQKHTDTENKVTVTQGRVGRDKFGIRDQGIHIVQSVLSDSLQM